ncbi:vitamin B12 transporter [Novimethylophilus kurashikiensis]|uniref:Vitamin B12 transporter n=1 Tax=Novimethylophilus kurashikiensis TaxID=1825523 RepID=A0A2R5F6A8_9PROT|nr:TonB-dependent receptor [Novimethylophilus kurashikiensis]GBG13822.1 vitamin B12 transporter [Novimethylophilus kurashikiensis]
MKKITVAGLAGLLSAVPAYAHDSIYSDDVVVTANRIPQPREAVLADVSVITGEEIARSGQSSLVEVLRTLPGVEIESNGGLGMASAVHLRGTSSQSVVVLVDGLRVGSATLGTTAFEQISPDQVERIEVVRGPASSLYGADAVGGVIQIFTKHGESKPVASVSFGYGSYNTRKATASLSGAIGDTRASLNISTLNTDGISSLRNQTERAADHDAYRNESISASIDHKIVDGHEIGLQIYDSFNHAQFDDDSLFSSHQYMTQRGISLTSRNQITTIWHSTLRVGEGEDALKSFGSSFGENIIRTYQRQYLWQNDVQLPLGTLTLAYDRLEQHVVSLTEFAKTHRNDNGWLASYLLDEGPHSFQFSMRRDDNSQFGQHTTGNIAYGYRFNQFWKVSGSYGTAFRAPTFADLYWPFQDFGPSYGTYQGNPNLKPETSRNREVSLTYDQGHHRVTATAYHNEVNNLLVCCQGLFHDFPTNVGSATINGVTLAYEGWFDRYHLRANSDFQSPKDDETGHLLSRRSRAHGAIYLGQTWDKLELGTEVVSSGARYDDAANTRRLGGYTLVNFTGKYELSPEWSLEGRINNVFDKYYTLATFYGTPYSTPGANLFVGLRWQSK